MPGVGGVVDVLFPRTCAGCGRGPWPFCDGCRAGLVVPPPGCPRCGAPTSGLRAGACEGCPDAPIGWVRSAFLFEGPVRSAIHRLKFGGDRGVALALGTAMSAVPTPRLDDRVLVSWVPAAADRRRRRGFDQARLLARIVARRRGLPVRASLRRTRAEGPQARRQADERRVALAGAFGTRGEVHGSVLLVDDVFTTGATVSECARVLVDAGASRVDVLTAARTPRRVHVPTRGTEPPLLSSDGFRPGSVVDPGHVPPGSRCQPRAKRPT